jgi:hypothetical protein
MSRRCHCLRLDCPPAQGRVPAGTCSPCSAVQVERALVKSVVLGTLACAGLLSLADVQGGNVVNGRYIGQSYDAGPQPFGNSHSAWKDPVSAGDVYGNPSRLLQQQSDGKTLYVKSTPMQWALRGVPRIIPLGVRDMAKNGITKLEGVKRALAELGPDAMPLAIKDYLKTKLGIDISGDVASTYKKTLARQAKGDKQPAGDGVSLQDIEAVKDLIGRVGTDNLRTLIDLLS